MTEEKNNLSELPKGWVWATLPNTIGINGIFVDGDWVESKDQNPNGEVRLIQLADIGDGYFRNRSDRFLTFQKAIELKCTFLMERDLLIARMPDPLGRACLFPLKEYKKYVTVVDVAIVRTDSSGIDNRYLMYVINTPQIRSKIDKLQTGTTRKRIPRSKLATISLPLPPLPEQHRIVTKIEELFTKLDAGVEALKKVKAQLKRYRQAALKYAFEGKLTAEWREAHKDELEPASVLLERIKEERKKTLGKKYKEPNPVDTTDLPPLPDGWVWSNLDWLVENHSKAIKAGPFGSSLKKEFYTKTGFKIYGQEQVIRGDPFFGDYYIDIDRYKSLESCSVKPGDVLISLVGTIGKVLVLPNRIEPGIINPRLVRLSLDQRIVAGKYIKSYIESSSVRQFFSLLSHGGTMDILNLKILKQLPIPLPSLHEQSMLVQEIERSFSIAEEIEKVIDQSLTQADRLRQSILKRAFEGKLVPQDPSDEPAEKLLERIKAERESRETEGNAQKKGKKKKDSAHGRHK